MTLEEVKQALAKEQAHCHQWGLRAYADYKDPEASRQDRAWAKEMYHKALGGQYAINRICQRFGIDGAEVIQMAIRIEDADESEDEES